ncbi:MAG: hypothetical protein ACRDV8_07395, partial [Acidimicrobiales bacterium]
SVSTSSSSGELSRSAAGSSPSHSMTLRVAGGSSAAPIFYYEDLRAGTPTIEVSAAGWTSATQTETVTTAATLGVTLAPGAPSRSAGDYHVPLTATVTSVGMPVDKASVTITVDAGSCTGAQLASGIGSTNARGDVVFTFTTGSAGSYCAKASARAPGVPPGSTSVQFTVSAAMPPVASGAGFRASVGWARAA